MLKNVVFRAVLLSVLALAALPAPASAKVLYGAEPGANSPLYIINPGTGAFSSVGNIGFGVGALAFHPTTGVLYGVTAQFPATSTLRALIRIDPATGAGTLIGNIGLGVGGIADIAFRADGTLFGWSENTDDLITINISTGAGTVVGNAGVSTRGSGLAFDTSGTLYLAGNNANGALRTVNTATGITTIVATLNGAPAPANFPIPAMKFFPGSNVLYAVNRTAIGPASTGRLITINTTTGAITVIGPTVNRLDAPAWSPVPPPAPPLPPAFPPTITAIPDQTTAQDTPVTVSFTIAGAILPQALRVTASSSNTSLLPASPSAFGITCGVTGACTMRFTPADGRSGTGVVTVSVFDGFFTVSTSFTLTVITVRPTAPGVVLANQVGSGIAVTWSAPVSGTPIGYAVSWGTFSGGANLPVQLVPGTTLRLDISAVPSGTYFFRVHAIGNGDMSPPSPQTSVAVTSSAGILTAALTANRGPGRADFALGWEGDPPLLSITLRRTPAATASDQACPSGAWRS